MASTHTLPYKNVVLVALSGIPGAGKSTAIRELEQSTILNQRLFDAFPKKKIVVRYVLERSDEWKAKGYLKEFYSNISERALSFQLIVFHSHIEAVQEALRDHGDDKFIVCIVDRSVWDQLLFWKHQDRSRDFMDDNAYMLDWNMKSQLIPPVSMIFFCKTKDIQTTMRRMKKRESLNSINGREQLLASMANDNDDDDENTIIENAGGIKLDYQTNLYEKHCQWFASPLTIHGVPCVHLDTQMPYHNDYNALEELAMRLSDEIIRLIH